MCIRYENNNRTTIFGRGIMQSYNTQNRTTEHRVRTRGQSGKRESESESESREEACMGVRSAVEQSKTRKRRRVCRVAS